MFKSIFELNIYATKIKTQNFGIWLVEKIQNFFEIHLVNFYKKIIIPILMGLIAVLSVLVFAIVFIVLIPFSGLKKIYNYIERIEPPK